MAKVLQGVSLFAGIGGFDLAMESAGINVRFMAEIDKDCQKVLGSHFPQATLYYDVKKVTASAIKASGFWPEYGVLTAGWPCQGNSVAGLRKGLDDPRSGLWVEVVRILDELRPAWFVGENVPGLLTVRGGADFYEVIKSLDELGYGVAWRVLDAQNFGVPQRRRRVLVVGCLGDPASAAKVLFEPESGLGDSEASGEAGEEAARAAAVSTLQGGGRRGYRVDAESAAGGHLVPCCVTGDITHTLRPEGADAGEDGTGRGTPIIAYQVAAPLTSGNPGGGTHQSGRRQEDDYNLVAYDASMQQSQDVAYALSAHHQHLDRENTYVVAPTLTAGWGTNSGAPGHGGKDDAVLAVMETKSGVRRLTPLECERLQGFPDGWTAGQSDSARYRQLGNAVAVPVIEWLMRRIVACG